MPRARTSIVLISALLCACGGSTQLWGSVDFALLHVPSLLPPQHAPRIAGSSSSSPPIVGEWTISTTSAPSLTTNYFFNADGTVGIRESERSASFCDADHGYSLRGDSLTMTSTRSEAGRGGVSQQYTVSFSNGNNSLTLFTTGSCDGAACTGTLTRVNSKPTNSCLVVAIRH
jgi:hypothetical protein